MNCFASLWASASISELVIVLGIMAGSSEKGLWSAVRVRNWEAPACRLTTPGRESPGPLHPGLIAFSPLVLALLSAGLHPHFLCVYLHILFLSHACRVSLPAAKSQVVVYEEIPSQVHCHNQGHLIDLRPGTPNSACTPRYISLLFLNHASHPLVG